MTMTAKQIRKAREGSGLTAGKFAERIGIAPNSLTKYERGDQPVPRVVERSVILEELLAHRSPSA